MKKQIFHIQYVFMRFYIAYGIYPNLFKNQPDAPPPPLLPELPPATKEQNIIEKKILK